MIWKLSDSIPLSLENLRTSGDAKGGKEGQFLKVIFKILGKLLRVQKKTFTQYVLQGMVLDEMRTPDQCC